MLLKDNLHNSCHRVLKSLTLPLTMISAKECVKKWRIWQGGIWLSTFCMLSSLSDQRKNIRIERGTGHFVISYAYRILDTRTGLGCGGILWCRMKLDRLPEKNKRGLRFSSACSLVRKFGKGRIRFHVGHVMETETRGRVAHECGRYK